MWSPTGELSSVGKATVTSVTMFCTCLVGFVFQQYLINTYYSGEKADLHHMVKEIHKQEVAELERRGQAEAEARRRAGEATHSAGR